jgi:phospholipase C
MTRNQNQRRYLRCASLLSVALMGTMQTTKVLATTDTNDSNTNTPIKHVIVVVGENRTFDHLFATYQPKTGTVANLLSKGIINADGTPGANFSVAAQSNLTDTTRTTYSINPTNTKQTYSLLPVPKAGGPQSATDTITTSSSPPPFATTNGIISLINGINAKYGGTSVNANGFGYPYNLPYVPLTTTGTYDLGTLTTGATGIASGQPDTRIPAVSTNSLPSGPFPLTGLYDAYAASPVHRFYQMWQQVDCNVGNKTTGNPSGCQSDLFAWVENTVAAGSNGAAVPNAGFVSQEGSTALGFYNVQKGDLAYFKSLADNYTIADNYHQAIMGGTGANSIMLGTADPLWYSDGKGNAATPPNGSTVTINFANSSGTLVPTSTTLSEIENPNPQSGSNNYYTQDGYSGGTYTNCSDTTQPGVLPITNYLNSLSPTISPNCQSGHYYLLNNYDPGYYGDGTVNYNPADSTNPHGNPTWGASNGGYVIPPSSVPTIAEKLSNNHISWSYYGEGWNAYKANPDAPVSIYCNICNPFQYSTAVMTGNDLNGNPLRNNLKDISDFDNDVTNNTLPAVSYIKPGGLLDGHPASSKFTLFESLVKRVITKVQSNPNYAGNTAILITVDEGGGYYDSGYIQPLDYFGDGTRIPLIVVSPYSTGGRVVHTYYDHASVIKFIEANWNQNGSTTQQLPTLSTRSRDNYPNPVIPITRGVNPYIPTNSPAIGNLMNMFQFPSNQPAD